jgi:peptidylprolyl isomerase
VRTRLTLRRLLPAAAVLLLAAPLSACGGNSGNSGNGGSGGSGAKTGLDAVSVTGAVGSSLTVAFTGAVTDPTTVTKVLVTGNGPPVKEGDSVILQTAIADGLTQKTVADSYTDHAPQLVPIDSNVSAIYSDALLGKPIGSRVLISATADKIFGASGNPQLGIGNKDVVLIMFDLVGSPVAHPDGKKSAAPAWAPKVVAKGGRPTGFDFTKAPKPDGKLHSATLRAGSGAKVTKGQTIFASYLGEVYGGTKPFDQNFTGGTPASFQIGVGKVISGWDKTLVGQRVGSEVLLAIPPKDGYGKGGNSGAHIKGTDTLYFVVDVVGAA